MYILLQDSTRLVSTVRPHACVHTPRQLHCRWGKRAQASGTCPRCCYFHCCRCVAVAPTGHACPGSGEEGLQLLGTETCQWPRSREAIMPMAMRPENCFFERADQGQGWLHNRGRSRAAFTHLEVLIIMSAHSTYCTQQACKCAQ